VTQDAFIAALRHWSHDGIPARPSAWLLQVARRKALDALRRDRALESRLPEVTAEFERIAEGSEEAAERTSRDDGAQAGGGSANDPFADDRLRMILLCCHPAVSEDSRVALTLKLVSGFSVGEIARAFLADEPAVAQRLVRAKKALRDANVTFEMPSGDDLRARLDAVHAVLYLMFNEGHTTHEGESLLRRDLCAEALRLAERLGAHEETADPVIHALAALFAFNASRFDARTDDAGALVTLAKQDRTKWDRALIARGFLHLDAAAGGVSLSSYHVEARIASLHAIAASWEMTDWASIVEAYDRLLEMTQSPVVALNRVVALRELHGAARAMKELEAIRRGGALDEYHLFHAVRAELLAATGKPEEARRAWERAGDLARSAPVQRHIAQRLGSLREGDVDSLGVRPS
jgi:RNA polymerase sigma-70 factor (ECF subfamily)